jgi:hypothetical protein
MRFEAKHVVTMVVALCAAAVLAPVGVMAATGQHVNITDPVIGSRQVRVGSAGALQVETRPGVTSTAANVSYVDIQNLTPRKLAEVTAPTRIALSEVTIGVHNIGNPVAEPTVVELNQYVHVSGTTACGLSGWNGTVLRRVTLQTDDTLHLKFDGPPLIVPTPASGTRFCLAAKLYQWVGETKVDVGATVFTYS